jgi:hypothetical protein
MNRSSLRRNYQWYGLGVLWAGAIVLAVAGFAHYAAWHQLAYSFFDDFYLSLQLITMNSGAVAPPVPVELNLARFLIPLLAGATAVKALWQVFRQQIRMASLRRLSGHFIICGLSRKGFLLANQFHRRGDAVVVIERDEENDWLESCREQGMYLLIGDASDATLLRLAGVTRARGLFAVCDDDGMNIEIALRAQELAKQRPGEPSTHAPFPFGNPEAGSGTRSGGRRSGEPLPCLLHVTDPQLCALLREQEASLERAAFRLELFNVFERGARRMLQAYPAWKEDQVRVTTPVGAGTHPRMLLVGLGRMGENLVLHAARDWRNQHPDKTRRLQITIIDRYAERKVESLGVRFPQLVRACELVPLQMEIHSPEFERASFLFDAHGAPCLDSIYICVDDDSLGLHAGLTLQRRLADCDAPIVVRMAENSGLARLLADHQSEAAAGVVSGASKAYHNLFGFGYLDQTCTPELLNNTPRDNLARAAHEEFVQQQLKSGSVTLSNPALQPWERLAAGYREASYRWVDQVSEILSGLGYTITPLTDWDEATQELQAGDAGRLAQLMQEMLKGEENAAGQFQVDDIPAFLGRAGFQVERN